MRCHRPGTAAPMVLETYEQVRPFASMIQHSVETRTMPPAGILTGPWASRTSRTTRRSRRGNRDDRQVGGRGYARGDLTQLPATRDWKPDHEYWQLEQDQGWGPPDMIITSPPFTVPANSGDQWWEPGTHP